eukprot:gene11589-12981_t
MVEQLVFIDYGGKRVTQPELELINYIQSQRDSSKREKEDRELEQRLLANHAKTVAARVESIRAANEALQSGVVSTSADRESFVKPVNSVSVSNINSSSSSSSSSAFSSSQAKQQQSQQPSSSSSSSSTTIPKIKKDDTKRKLDGSSNEDEEVPTEPLTQTQPQQPQYHRPISKRKKVEEESDSDSEVVVDLRPFSALGMLHESIWKSSDAENPLLLFLRGYDCASGSNTLALEYTAALDSSGWSLNLTSSTDEDNMDVFFHFNPRYSKSSLIMNDRQGTWGDAEKKRLHSGDGLWSSQVRLIIQFRLEGFLLFANDKFAAFFPHRRELGGVADFRLVFSTEDDNGHRHEVTVSKVWWGRMDFHREILSPSVRATMERAVAEPPRCVTNPYPPRTVIISNLSMSDDLEYLQGMEYTLFDLFNEFKPESVAMVRGKGKAFCRLPSPEDVPGAIKSFQGVQLETPDGVYTLELQPMATV